MTHKKPDPFLAALEDGASDTLTCLVDALPPVAPNPLRTKALFDLLDATPRHARFADTVAELLDIDREGALSLLEAVDQPASWAPGLFPQMQLFHVDGGPAVAQAVTGFVRLEAGAAFPEHRHLGEERCLVLQGYYTDLASGREYGPGDLAVAPTHSAHGFKVVDGGTGLLFLAIIQQGIAIGDQILRYDSPDL